MNTAFYFVHPFPAFLYFLFAVMIVMLYQHPFFLGAGCLLLMILHLLLDRGQTVRRWLPGFILLFIFIFAITPLFNHRGNHILFNLFNQPITLEAVLQGLMNALTIVAILLLAIGFNIIMTADKFLFLFSKGFPKWALVAMLALRFIPLFTRRLKEIVAVQKTKGKSVTKGRFKNRIKTALELVQILLTWSLEEGIQTADSMTSRGYGLTKRTKYHPYKVRKEDVGILLFLALTTLYGIFGWYLGDGVLTLTPVLEPVWLYGREWAFFAGYIILLGLPLWVEAKESLAWYYWKRKH